MGKEGKTGARAAETNKCLQKDPHLESMDSGCGVAVMQGVISIIEDEGSEPCHHFLAAEDQVDSIVANIKSRNQAPACEHCLLDTLGSTTSRGSRKDPPKQQRDKPSALIMVCLECKRCLCAGVGVAITDRNPRGHARCHAHKKGHWVALWFDRPYKAYCFSCGCVLCLNQSNGGENEVASIVEKIKSRNQTSRGSREDLLEQQRDKPSACALWLDQPSACDCVLCLDQSDGGENEVLESAVDDESGAHPSRPGTDELCYVIRGIPNYGNTCYVNALVQCLLALDKLRMWMLGPKAPMRSLGVALKELFVETTPGNDAGAKLNPKKLLESLGALNERYAGGTMEDIQELLLDMHKGLSEERLQWPPKVRYRFPTVVDSIFQGQISSTLTCKWCLFDSPSHVPFTELSLALPSKGQNTKSVDSPQRSLAIVESNLKKVQTEATDRDKASKSLKTDSTKAEQIWQMDNDVHGFLQTPEDKISYTELLLEVIKMTQKSACVGDLSSQQEILVEAKENTCTVQVSPEDKGKALSRNFIYGDEEDGNSLASIEHCLALYFKAEEVEWHCDNCAKVSKEAGTGSPVKDSFSSSITSEESDCDSKAEKRIDTSIVQDSQNASTRLNRRMQIDLNVAPVDQVREDQIEQEDRKGHADKTVVISKLPPVLTVHLKRFDRVNNEQVKVPGHVSFGENLDVGQFLDPRSEDKDNSRYRLGGVIEHIGNSLNTGHNVAYVRASTIGNGSSLWFRASDEHIEKVSVEEVLKCEAFILFYERMEG